MVPMRVLLLFAIPLIGIFLQKSSSKSIDESNHHLESSSDLDGKHELIRTRREIDSAIADMTNSERAVADSELSNEDETHDIRKRWGRRRRKGGRRRSRRRRRVSVGRVMEGVGEGLGIMQSVKNLFGG
ncbi:uncharacterized protein LOC130046367 isoform X1 [Ostrea edulis]|uniref:uncharacterized protein LOC130046367 isoform X1 n=1 Tax=Ostrea edulis TaxID=37623 RepID=UPI0024AF71A1|nr:uncharacterized protein LOC130046367 isoform X1 [Ostrea edulis]